MIDDWFEVIELPLSFEQFLALPANPAYKYEYFDGRAVLSPRPKCYQALLDLRAEMAPCEFFSRDPILLRPLREDDWERLEGVFSSAFHRVQPFCGLDDDRRLQAARQCLAKTRGGGDGPILEGACIVAAREDVPIAAVLVTVQRVGDDGDPEAEGRDLPHLTWIFVAPMRARLGLGSALLAASVRELIPLGHDTLASTFLLGNESSTLWHWRNGFRLRGYLGSPRHYRKRPSSGTEPSP